MDDQNSEQAQQPAVPDTAQGNQPNQEKKEERIDELDIIGGMLLRFIQKLFSGFRRTSPPQQ